MAVKRSKSGTRILAVLERIASTQPIGVSELARLMDADKSAMQRAVMTLADEGWVAAAPGSPGRWQTTGRLQLVAHDALGSSGLRQRARPALEALRDATGETVGLTVPDIGRFVVIEVMECRQLLRTAPHVGMEVTINHSATGRAVLAYLPRAQQVQMWGGAPDAAFEAELRTVRECGYFVSEDDDIGGSINVAAPVFEVDGRPHAAVILSAPRVRLPPDQFARVGAMVSRTANELSLARPVADPSVTIPGDG